MRFMTDRTILRAYMPGDAEQLLKIWGDPDVQELLFTGRCPSPLTLDFVEQTLACWLLPPSFLAIIEDRKTGAFIGEVGLLTRKAGDREASIGITIAREFRGRGYGSEVMRWIVGFGFRDMHLTRISLHVFEGNERAVALYQNLGFIHEGESQQEAWVQGRWQKVLLMGLQENEWDIVKKRRRIP
ncbi:acyl-CoA N-acyltransferase [Vararia minispora EC-137]|uniref:Acyl-CoA N-acyltransferase n=1 Tax=Vararia minispora EC-137 TaxID=1314806 RepID=A0ACB8QFR9_9AGAM|nr:acyl-CoA N-acyltransferase [Vararia minispora EC-137]